MMEEMTNLVSVLGFPIAITCYLLYERFTLIKSFTKAINDLRVEIVKLNERCKESKK